MKLEYFDRFGRLENLKDVFVLEGARMLVEILERDEMKTKGGLILADPGGYKTETQVNRPLFAVVLHTGPGEVDDEGVLTPSEYKRGSVLMINPVGPGYFSEFPGLGATKNKIAVASPHHVGMSWPTVEAFEKFRAVLGE